MDCDLDQTLVAAVLQCTIGNSVVSLSALCLMNELVSVPSRHDCLFRSHSSSASSPMIRLYRASIMPIGLQESSNIVGHQL